MAHRPRTRTIRLGNSEYTRPLREKRKDKKAGDSRSSRRKQKDKAVKTAKEISEVTLKRLHTLGSQKFGSSPFRDHFDRWVANVKAVLLEFESSPNVAVDDQFVRERKQVLSLVEQQLQEKIRKETRAEEETRTVSRCKLLLEQFKIEYIMEARKLRIQKNKQVKELYTTINQLKKDQDEAIHTKTGLLRHIFRNEREDREAGITQNLADRNRDLEFVMLNYKTANEKLRDDYEKKSLPVFQQMKNSQKNAEPAETDNSLEDRWFACQALVDAVNMFLQRKALQNH